VSYGSLARFRSCSRIKKVGEFTILGASGEYSDFQSTSVMLDELMYVLCCTPPSSLSFSLHPRTPVPAQRRALQHDVQYDVAV
jgi:hypothetical protein